MCWNQNKVTEQSQQIKPEHRHNGRTCLSFLGIAFVLSIFFLWTAFQISSFSVLDFSLSWISYIMVGYTISISATWVVVHVFCNILEGFVVYLPIYQLFLEQKGTHHHFTSEIRIISAEVSIDLKWHSLEVIRARHMTNFYI